MAPINPSDLGSIDGTYPLAKPFPAVGGGEGVGTVVEVGNGVKNLKIGDVVVPSRFDLGMHSDHLLSRLLILLIGTWTTHILAQESDLISIDPKGVASDHLACLSVNPTTALRLLEDFVKLEKGDVIIQNGANSMVGRCITQIASERGIKTINILRKGSVSEDELSTLKSYKNSIVETYETLSTHSFRNQFQKSVKLAINGIGGSSVDDMGRLLVDGGSVVTYGAMSRKPITIPSSMLLFRDIRFRGFWLHQWNQEHTLEERQKMFSTLLDMMKQKKLTLNTDILDFETGLYEAIARSTKSNGKKQVLEFGKKK